MQHWHSLVLRMGSLFNCMLSLHRYHSTWSCQVCVCRLASVVWLLRDGCYALASEVVCQLRGSLDLLGLYYSPWYPIPKTDESLSVPAPSPIASNQQTVRRKCYTLRTARSSLRGLYVMWRMHCMSQVYKYRVFGEENWKNETIWRNWETKKEYQKRILQKQDGRSSTEFIWLSTRTGGGVLWTRYWTIRSHKMFGIPGLTWQNSHRCV